MSGPPQLLDRVRGAIRARHYSRRTEEAYVYWIRRYIVFHGKKHPSCICTAVCFGLSLAQSSTFRERARRSVCRWY